MDIYVLGGGDSPEREVSLRSSMAVASAGREAGYKIIQLDPAEDSFDLDNIPAGAIVLPILHGRGGEDGVLQAELEKKGIAYLGSDSVSSAKSFDKWLTRQTLAKAGVPIAEGYLVTEGTYRQNPMSNKPHVLKIKSGGSSIGTLIVRSPDKLKETELKPIFLMDPEVVLEELIEGTETTVPILDQEALTPIEIIPPEGVEFDYENKYNGRTQELCPPSSIPEDVQRKCMELAEQVHTAMGCRHLSRVDIMIGSGGRPVVLEINTIPGLTDQSLFPKSAAVSGMEMPQLVTRFIDMVKRDYHL